MSSDKVLLIPYLSEVIFLFSKKCNNMAILEINLSGPYSVNSICIVKNNFLKILFQFCYNLTSFASV